jgi:apolipoprotein N-acyltransferase
LFRLGEFSFRVLICYEDTLSYLARDGARDGADFLLAISNDGWFLDTPELDQHWVASRFRSIETRLPLARAANTGISSIADPFGRVTDQLVVAGRRREVQGILTGNLSLASDSRPTVYVRLGDWWGGGSAALTLALTAVAALKHILARRRAPRALAG